MAEAERLTKDDPKCFLRLNNPILWGCFATFLVCGLAAWLGQKETCVLDADQISSCQSKWSAFISAQPNVVGDTLAGFAGTLAFVWIIATVWLQSQELSLQRAEIRETNEHLKEQNFDSFFFELVATHNSIVGSIDIRKKTDGTIVRQGRDSFGHFYKELALEQAERMYPDHENDKTFEKYERMYKAHHSDLGHYFRFVYNSRRAIDEAGVAQKKHRRLFRSLFSDDELLILFYNALSKRGTELLPYIQRFEFFDNLPVERLIYQSHKDLLDPVCFGEAPCTA